MISSETIRYELAGRFQDQVDGKTHLSVRFESAPRIARIGACLHEFTWDNRMKALHALIDFERDHADEFAVEYDIVPLEAVNDEAFADA